MNKSPTIRQLEQRLEALEAANARLQAANRRFLVALGLVIALPLGLAFAPVRQDAEFRTVKAERVLVADGRVVLGRDAGGSGYVDLFDAAQKKVIDLGIDTKYGKPGVSVYSRNGDHYTSLGMLYRKGDGAEDMGLSFWTRKDARSEEDGQEFGYFVSEPNGNCLLKMGIDEDRPQLVLARDSAGVAVRLRPREARDGLKLEVNQNRAKLQIDTGGNLPAAFLGVDKEKTAFRMWHGSEPHRNLLNVEVDQKSASLGVDRGRDFPGFFLGTESGRGARLNLWTVGKPNVERRIRLLASQDYGALLSFLAPNSSASLGADRDAALELRERDTNKLMRMTAGPGGRGLTVQHENAKEAIHLGVKGKASFLQLSDANGKRLARLPGGK